MGFIGTTLKTIGEVALGITVLLVHDKLVREKRLNEYMFKEIYREEFFGVISIILIIVGYFLDVMGI